MPSAGSQSTPAAVDIDIDAALERMGGDRELLLRLIDFVVEDSPSLMEKMNAALEDDRLEDVQHAAHSLRGLVSNVSCNAVQSQTIELERLAQSGNRDGAANSLKRLITLQGSMMAKLADVHRELKGA
jgi:HPt (histidine-containing phosphotransfer) domain-containing protein